MIQAIIAGGLMGLLSTPHCMVMCGPFMTISYPNQHRLIAVLSHQWARIVTYAILAIGFASFGPSWVIRSIFSLVAGIGILWTLRPKKKDCGSCHPQRPNLGLENHHPFLIGIIHGLIPCAISATAVLTAISMPSSLEALGFVIAFGMMTSLPFIAAHLPLVNRLCKPIIHWLHKHRKPMMGLLALWLIARAWLGFHYGESMMSHGLSQQFCLPW